MADRTQERVDTLWQDGDLALSSSVGDRDQHRLLMMAPHCSHPTLMSLRPVAARI